MAGDIFFDTIRDVVTRNVMQPTSRQVEILPVAHGNNAALMGAFSLILNKVLNLDFDARNLITNYDVIYT